jgi:hypothetical protein
MNHLPPNPSNNIRAISNFFLKIHGDIRESRCTAGINDTGGKFAAGVNYTGGKERGRLRSRRHVLYG